MVVIHRRHNWAGLFAGFLSCKFAWCLLEPMKIVRTEEAFRSDTQTQFKVLRVLGPKYIVSSGIGAYIILFRTYVFFSKRIVYNMNVEYTHLCICMHAVRVCAYLLTQTCKVMISGLTEHYQLSLTLAHHWENSPPLFTLEVKKPQMLQNAKIPFISCQSLGIIFAKVEESTLYRLCLSGCQLSASFSLAPWSSDNRWTPQVSTWNPKVFKGWWS